ncbi:hypothetical protein ACF0H5_022868 [Mactra antiquata]
MSSHDPKFKLVVAFDFGTTYSGYAFSFRDFPLHIKTNCGWSDGADGLVTMKAPTCLLMTPEDEFHSFGYEAENKYSSLAAEDKHRGWLLFRRFKMLLHNTEHLNRKTTVTDINGVSRPAIKIFTMAIRYLKHHFITNVFQQPEIGTFLSERDIKYVLTVPAIWSSNSKHFMREAAVEAGLEDRQLKLCLEPEAASIWCLSITKSIGNVEHFTGVPFMVIDLGGGTADIYVNEKKDDHTFKELYKAGGGPWGGKAVDENFVKWLMGLLGETVMNKFKEEHMCEYFDMLRNFEMAKRSFSADTTGLVSFKLSKILLQLFDENSDSDLRTIISESNLDGFVEFKDDHISVDSSIVATWFLEPISQMIEYVKTILARPDLSKVENILVVGGFSESKFVHDELNEKLKDKTITIPQDPGLAVVRGAVRFGQLPTIVSSRVVKAVPNFKLQ